jgi:beta-xylosidase
MKKAHLLFYPALLLAANTYTQAVISTGNPVITDVYTADPAALVVGDTVFLYTGHDEAVPPREGYVMHEWLCFSSIDMVHWVKRGSPLNVKAFAWAKDDAWASQAIERDGKYYFYAAIEHDSTHPGKAIAVAVSDSPEGPFKDARGSALITNDMTSSQSGMMWDDIDPTVIIDNGQAYLFWGNHKCYYARLKNNMTELDGDIKEIVLQDYTEAPWIHKRNNWYYLSYASGFPEKIVYAMSKNINGPWQYKGILNELAGNSNTNHQAIINFKGKDYFIYHNGGINTAGGSFRRSVCVDRLYYNTDGTMKRVIMTTEGVAGK